MEIIPAIIGKDFNEVSEKMHSVGDFVKWVQIDIMDGFFTQNVSWPFLTRGGEFELAGKLGSRGGGPKIEMHLMVKRPENYFDKLVEAGVDRVLVHYESTDEISLGEIFDELDIAEVEAGIALKLETPIDVLDEFMDKIDLVQLMSIAEIGAYGIPFDERVYDKIKSLRARYPGVTIEIDGGVSLENASKLVAAGADNLVIGSAIFKSESIPSTILKFKSIR